MNKIGTHNKYKKLIMLEQATDINSNETGSTSLYVTGSKEKLEWSMEWSRQSP